MVDYEIKSEIVSLFHNPKLRLEFVTIIEFKESKRFEQLRVDSI